MLRTPLSAQLFDQNRHLQANHQCLESSRRGLFFILFLGDHASASTVHIVCISASIFEHSRAQSVYLTRAFDADPPHFVPRGPYSAEASRTPPHRAFVSRLIVAVTADFSSLSLRNFDLIWSAHLLLRTGDGVQQLCLLGTSPLAFLASLTVVLSLNDTNLTRIRGAIATASTSSDLLPYHRQSWTHRLEL